MSAEPAVVIVPAAPDDAEAIEGVRYKAWLATYPDAGLGITVEDIDDRFRDRFTPAALAKKRDRLANAGPEELTLVARRGGDVIGFCHCLKKADKNQLTAIYILPAWQRHGIGRSLWEHAKPFFDPSNDIIVQVATYNAAAIAFYEGLGFEDTGIRFSDERFRMKSGAVIPEMELAIRAIPS